LSSFSPLAPGALFSFSPRSRSTSLSPVLCFVIVFSFRAVVRSQSAKISSWLCSAHPAEALAQLLCEKSRLLEGGEVVALLYLAFASASRFRKAASPASDTSTHFGSGEASAS